MDNHFGLMLDCSRNAVFTVESVKKLVEYMAKMGYNTLMLYTEDTYEVKGEPYFGYLRGRYSSEELKTIDAFCIQHGIELIPCIQTLAHLNAIFRWDRYDRIKDIEDILLIDSEETYELIEKMISSVAENFTSRNIHIGMDEAFLVGLGFYLRKHGYTNRYELLHRHLERVKDICKKYGFSPMMWSDMFFNLTTGAYYVKDPDVIKKEFSKYVPEEVSLVYWDYYSTDKSRYDTMIKAHRNFDRPIWFAGGIWTWVGFLPKNGFSIKASIAAVKSCIDNGVENMIFTLWGDDGGECSLFSVLPSIFYVSQLRKGIENEEEIKSNFKEMFGIDYDALMLLDLPEINGSDEVTNPEKYMLYNDYFLGIYDPIAVDGLGEKFKEASEKLKRHVDEPEYGYLFRFTKALCDVMAVKYDLGIRTRELYSSHDKEKLKTVLPDYEKVERLLETLLDDFRKMWFAEKKPYGFELQEARIGALIARTKSCKNRLADYANGKTEKIDELEEELLMPSAFVKPDFRKTICMNRWNLSFINKTGFFNL